MNHPPEEPQGTGSSIPTCWRVSHPIACIGFECLLATLNVPRGRILANSNPCGRHLFFVALRPQRPMKSMRATRSDNWRLNARRKQSELLPSDLHADDADAAAVADKNKTFDMDRLADINQQRRGGHHSLSGEGDVAAGVPDGSDLEDVEDEDTGRRACGKPTTSMFEVEVEVEADGGDDDVQTVAPVRMKVPSVLVICIGGILLGSAASRNALLHSAEKRTTTFTASVEPTSAGAKDSVDAARTPLPPPLPNTSLPCATLLDQLTPPKSTCPGRTRPLLIMAGDGKTGTSTYAWAAQELGLATGHWDDFLCPNAMGIAECTRRERAWLSFRSAVWGLKPSELASFDYCGALKDLDAVADVPISQLFPFLYAAHSDARVVLTVRKSEDWYPRRIRWMQTDMAPNFWISGTSISDTCTSPNGSTLKDCHAARGTVGHNAQVMGMKAASWTYFAELAVVVCLVPPDRLIITDLFSGHSDPHIDAERWQRLAQLADMPLPGWAATRPFRGMPPECVAKDSKNSHSFAECISYWRSYDEYWKTHDRSDRGEKVHPPHPTVLRAGANWVRYLAPLGAGATSGAYSCAGRRRPLVLLAGQGATGTGTYARALQQLGLAVGHWDAFLCPGSMGIAECTRRERAWLSFRSAVWGLKPSELASFDYCGALKDLDAVADVPISQLFPFLYAAHSDARVVLTVQNSVEWYHQRALDHHGLHAAPFYWMMERSLSQIYMYPRPALGSEIGTIFLGGTSLELLERQAAQSPSVASVGWATSQCGRAVAWSYMIEMALTMCTVPPSRNMRQAS